MISQPGWSRSNKKALSPPARIVRAARDQDEVLGLARTGDVPFAALITQRSPWRVARVRIMLGSEPPPGAGSVIAKAERVALHDRPQPTLLLRR